MTSFLACPSCWSIPSIECVLLRYLRCPVLVFLVLLSSSLIFSHLSLYFRGPQPLYSALISCHTTHSAISKLTTIHGLNPKLKLKSYVINKEKEMATPCSTRAWEIPRTEGPGGLLFMGSHRVRRDLVIKSEKEMATHSSVLAWRIPRTEEPGGLPSMGSHGVEHDWSDLAAAAAVHTYQAQLKHFKFITKTHFSRLNLSNS